ncbi:MAG TPA: glycosyltransferase [Rhodanobacteraceae bacterium]|nr:glycosyltransferase [Rhodanobacteraceae bacterium]
MNHVLGSLAAIVVTVVFVWYTWHALRGHDLSVYADPKAVAAIAAAALIYCCGVPLSALAWQGTLRGVGTRRSWRELTAILGITQIAKYIPGNVGQYIGRGALSMKRGIEIRPFTITVLLEIVLSVAAALLVGVCTGMLSRAGLGVVHARSLQLLLVFCALVAAAAAVLTFRRFAPPLLRRIAPRRAHVLEGELLPPKRWILRAFVLYCCTCLTVGVALVVLAHMLLPHARHEDWLLLAAFSLAWIVGFVTPGAPAGLGVREGLLLLMLGPVYGAALAGVLIIALRITTILGDLLACLGGFALLPRQQGPAAPGRPPSDESARGGDAEATPQRAEPAGKTRVLFISRKWPPAVGGMENHAVVLAGMLEQDFEVVRLVLPGRADGRPPSLARYAWFIARACAWCLMRGRRFDHLVLGDLLMFPAAICSRLVRKHQRRVVVVHGLDLVYGDRRGLLPRLYAAYFRGFHACRGIFSNIVAVSSFTAGLATAKGFTGVVTIHPVPRVSPAIDGGRVALPAAFTRAKRRILQFGRLVPRKGALWFARNVLPRLPGDVELFVAGPATDARYLAALKACARTTCLGIVPADVLVRMIRIADAVIMPNIPSAGGGHDVEGFGLVATETSALGGVLVASRWQGLTDAVVDGVTGTLATPADPDAWEHALVELLDESAEQRAQRRRIAERETPRRYSRARAATEFARLLVAKGDGECGFTLQAHGC